MLVFMFCISINPIFSKEEKYPEHVCKEIYGAIGTFLGLADKEWKQKNEEKALFYSQAAANYSTVYETVCRKNNP
ncbi:uncharacterized protein METZ01_LOCUS412934 [marine metagenome]|uniref:Uncharacterized protein n=1 Tax=marine metagenome TaxID=408172 RepID=A0A382WNA1_9ZZZZ